MPSPKGRFCATCLLILTLTSFLLAVPSHLLHPHARLHFPSLSHDSLRHYPSPFSQLISTPHPTGRASILDQTALRAFPIHLKLTVLPLIVLRKYLYKLIQSIMIVSSSVTKRSPRIKTIENANDTLGHPSKGIIVSRVHTSMRSNLGTTKGVECRQSRWQSRSHCTQESGYLHL